jgi:putative spermidine/putrescine transport system substrate-binding protein
MQTEIGAGEGALSIIAWTGYIERESDPTIDWVTGFEADTGCLVEVKVAATSDEMVSLMNQGGYDLVTASGDASLRLIYGGRVQPVNIDLIPSYTTNVDPRLQDVPWHTVDGVHYGVPYQWGPNVLMYNTEAFGGTPPDSWNVVFEEMTLADGQSNQGRVQAYDGPIYVADAAMYLMAHNPELGITDPYELTQEQFDAAIALLGQQRQLISRYWHDAIAQTDDFTNEGVVASTSWPYQVNLLQAAGSPIDSVVPAEGATGWADTTMMAVDAPHPNCAYLWLEHSLDPKLQGDLASWFGSVPAVPAACTGNELLTDEGCMNGFGQLRPHLLLKTPIADCGDACARSASPTRMGEQLHRGSAVSRRTTTGGIDPEMGPVRRTGGPGLPSHRAAQCRRKRCPRQPSSVVWALRIAPGDGGPFEAGRTDDPV